MKKFLAFSVLLSVLGASAFADGELTITGKADLVLMPLQLVSHEEQPTGVGTDKYDDLYVGAGIGRNGNVNGPRIRLDVAGNMDDKIGFRAELRFFESNVWDFGDWANVWWQPIEMLKFNVGRFKEDALRGKVGDDDWQQYTVKMEGNDDIFQRFDGNLGAYVGLTPMKPLTIGVLIPNFKITGFLDDGQPNGTPGSDIGGNALIPDPSDPDETIPGPIAGNSTGDSNRALRVYENIQVGAGFDLGMGLIRVQFVGASGGGSISQDIEESLSKFKAPRFELAFAFTGMEGLVIDFGAKAWLPLTDWVTDEWNPAKQEYVMYFDDTLNPGNAMYKGTYWKGLQFGLGATFNAGALKINGRFDALDVAASYEGDSNNVKYAVGPTLNFHLWPSYDLGIFELGLDFGLKVKFTDNMEQGSQSGDTYNDDFRIGFGLWGKKTFGNGSIRGGLACSLGEHGDGPKTGLGSDAKDKVKYPFVLSVPVIFSYSF